MGFGANDRGLSCGGVGDEDRLAVVDAHPQLKTGPSPAAAPRGAMSWRRRIAAAGGGEGEAPARVEANPPLRGGLLREPPHQRRDSRRLGRLPPPPTTPRRAPGRRSQGSTHRGPARGARRASAGSPRRGRSAGGAARRGRLRAWREGGVARFPRSRRGSCPPTPHEPTSPRSTIVPFFFARTFEEPDLDGGQRHLALRSPPPTARSRSTVRIREEQLPRAPGRCVRAQGARLGRRPAGGGGDGGGGGGFGGTGGSGGCGEVWFGSFRDESVPDAEDADEVGWLAGVGLDLFRAAGASRCRLRG